MTLPPRHHQLQNDDDTWADQCTLYLLGELQPEQLAEFERQLASSSTLGERLLQQAEIIARVSSQQTFPASPVRPVTHHDGNPWAWVASLVAIAACLTLALIGLYRSGSDTQRIASLSEIGKQLRTRATDSSEDLLIARAWAESPIPDAGDLYELGEADQEVTMDLGDDPADNDATLDWMFVALAIGLEAEINGAGDDG